MTLGNEKNMCAVNFVFLSIAYSLSNICTGRINIFSKPATKLEKK